uniref:NOL1/NOP2/NSUN 5/7 ferredoxin-like domain-containing protein n=1 Tax=Salarias fasciatus TaxID=181472 RepID=A0A672F4G9_SALFA
MGKKRSTGRRLNVSNMKKAGSLIKSSKDSKDLAVVDEQADSRTPAAPPEPQTTSESHLGFPDTVYLLASVVFQNHHLEKVAAHRLVNYGKERGLSLPEVKDEVMQCTAHELAFNTLKYQELLEDIMIDSDQMSLVAVMLYDFQDRQFLPRKDQIGDIIPEVRHVEKCLLRFKTKLAASLARCRVRSDLLSIEYTLPESMRRKQERSGRLPLYAWVNTLKSSEDAVQGVLESAGFLQVESIGQLEGQTFCHDPHCGDTLVFPAQLKAQLYSTRLLSEHKLIIQDKSCSLGPNAACSLLPEEGDVLMAGSFSGLTVSHTASLIAEKHKGNNQPTVYVCVSDCTDAQREELQLTVSTMGCTSKHKLFYYNGGISFPSIKCVILT